MSIAETIRDLKYAAAKPQIATMADEILLAIGGAPLSVVLCALVRALAMAIAELPEEIRADTTIAAITSLRSQLRSRS